MLIVVINRKKRTHIIPKITNAPAITGAASFAAASIKGTILIIGFETLEYLYLSIVTIH